MFVSFLLVFWYVGVCGLMKCGPGGGHLSKFWNQLVSMMSRAWEPLLSAGTDILQNDLTSYHRSCMIPITPWVDQRTQLSKCEVIRTPRVLQGCWCRDWAHRYLSDQRQKSSGSPWRSISCQAYRKLSLDQMCRSQKEFTYYVFWKTRQVPGLCSCLWVVCCCSLPVLLRNQGRVHDDPPCTCRNQYHDREMSSSKKISTPCRLTHERKLERRRKVRQKRSGLSHWVFWQPYPSNSRTLQCPASFRAPTQVQEPHQQRTRSMT